MHELVEHNTQVLASTLKSQARLKKSWQEFIWIFLFFAILSIGILSPISSTSNIPNMADFVNHLCAVIQAKMALAQGQFPLRTMPFELGYPLYQFYSPTSFTFIGLIYSLLTPSNPLIAINIAIWCGLMCGGLSMYYLAHWFIRSSPAAILAGVVYLYAPYYIIIVNHLGSFQEIFALGILPAIFYFVLKRYYYPDNLKSFLQLSAGLYLFFTLHMPTALYASILFAILLLMITIQNKKRVRNLLAVVITYAFAGLLAMWFLAPAALLQKYFVISNTYTDATHLIQYSPTLSNLLFPAAAITTGFKSNALMTFHPSLGLPILAGVAICVFAFFNKLTTGRKRADYFLPGLLLLFFIAFLFVWSPVNVWRWLPQPLLMAQYSWRLMGQVIWIGALLFAWAVYWLFKGKLETKHVLLVTILIITSVNPWFSSAENWEISLADFIKNPHLIYNGDAVTINYNKYPNLVTQIDSVNVDATQILHLNNPYFVPEALIKFAKTPIISITGNVNKSTKLIALVNDSPIASKTLKAGEFNWNIPLNVAKNQTSTQLEFITKDKSATANIPVHEFILTGFLKSDETLNLKQITPFCKQHNTIKVCELTIPPKVKILELPQLYYPQLLKITLNGKTVPYNSVIYQGRLITFITPKSGELNTVTIEFRGLPWANAFSWVAWACWLLLLIKFIVIRHMRNVHT